MYISLCLRGKTEKQKASQPSHAAHSKENPQVLCMVYHKHVLPLRVFIPEPLCYRLLNLGVRGIQVTTMQHLVGLRANPATLADSFQME